MITGVGLDIVEVARIEKAMRNPRFAPRVLTPRERAWCKTPASVAGRWAAKEAVAKALGKSLTWQNVEILPDQGGKPVVRIAGSNPATIHLSITHERQMAAAVAIIELS